MDHWFSSCPEIVHKGLGFLSNVAAMMSCEGWSGIASLRGELWPGNDLPLIFSLSCSRSAAAAGLKWTLMNNKVLLLLLLSADFKRKRQRAEPLVLPEEDLHVQVRISVVDSVGPKTFSTVSFLLQVGKGGIERLEKL